MPRELPPTASDELKTFLQKIGDQPCTLIDLMKYKPNLSIEDLSFLAGDKRSRLFLLNYKLPTTIICNDVPGFMIIVGETFPESEEFDETGRVITPEARTYWLCPKPGQNIEMMMNGMVKADGPFQMIEPGVETQKSYFDHHNSIFDWVTFVVPHPQIP